MGTGTGGVLAAALKTSVHTVSNTVTESNEQGNDMHAGHSSSDSDVAPSDHHVWQRKEDVTFLLQDVIWKTSTEIQSNLDDDNDKDPFVIKRLRVVQGVCPHLAG